MHLLTQYCTVSPCFQRILYRNSKFCAALHAHLLTQYFTVSPCFQRILYTIFYSGELCTNFNNLNNFYISIFNLKMGGIQKNWRAMHAFTNTILYCFTLFSAHSLPSFQILQRTLRELQKFEPFLHFYIQPQNWGGEQILF